MATLTKTVLADGRIEITGRDTFALREQIKARGGKWDGVRKLWTVPAGTSMLFAPPQPRCREVWSREEWQTWIAAFRARNRGRVERCCSGARDVGDVCGPSVYSCARHGETRGSYTGD
jgi:hypothetical protein